jgi:hypothetical protein
MNNVGKQLHDNTKHFSVTKKISIHESEEVPAIQGTKRDRKSLQLYVLRICEPTYLKRLCHMPVHTLMIICNYFYRDT